MGASPCQSSPKSVEIGARNAIRQALLGWFGRNRRELPWRGIDNPYAVWVSEVMLQQTQVATVIDYYQRWLDRFPTVEALANAELDEVMQLWAGLGYYRRARYLHHSARMVVDEMDGQLPATADDLEALKGVGPYTAGAVASIAFGQPTPVVDGNVERVLSRMYAIDGDPKSTSNQKLYWRLADALVDPDDPGDFNEAIMELGAMICTPQKPACMLCPVRSHCSGFEQGDPLAYPSNIARTRQRPVSVRTTIVVRDDAPKTGEYEFLVIKRPPDGLLGGLWEFPTVEDDGDPAAAMGRYLDECVDWSTGPLSDSEDLGEFIHHFSHLRMTIDVELRRQAACEGPARPRPTFDQPIRWVTASQLESLAMSAAMQKVYDRYKDHL